MQYYDRQTPSILIHSPNCLLEEPFKQLQFISPDFPAKIASNLKDSFLLDLALAAHQAETRLQFLYYYQVLEYAAFYFLDYEVRNKLLKIIATPDIHSDPEKYLSRLFDAMTDIKQSDEAKIVKVVETLCLPEIIWKEIENNLPFFSKRQEFAGGFVIEPFISENITLETFTNMWIPKTPDSLRKIRNALVHSRENRQGLLISPSRENDLKIRPWTSLIRRIAEQIIIYA